MVYGRRIEGKNDPIISLATGLCVILSKETTPERSGLLMAFPFRSCAFDLTKGLGIDCCL